MDIKLFDKKYVYLEWSDELEGKDCVLAKSYKDLKDFVNSGDEDRFCKPNKGKEKPFTNLWSECDFCYFDSNLKVKKAWIEGKTIQQYVLNEWEDYINLPRTSSYFYNIKWDAYEWRIKPTERFIDITKEMMNNDVLCNPFDSLIRTITSSSKDWSIDERDVWIYGIIVGWDKECYEIFEKKFNWWDKNNTKRLKEMHRNFSKIAIENNATFYEVE